MYKKQVVETDKKVLDKVTESSNGRFIPVEWIIKEDSKFWPPLQKNFGRSTAHVDLFMVVI